MQQASQLMVDKRTLKQIIRELKRWKAPATVLLTLYIPPGRPISDVVSLLRTEYSITDNIKLKRTRDAVQRALAAAMDRLTRIQKVPPNGLAVFCGEDMETKDFICFVFSPPEPVPVFFYRTDKWFHTEFLEEMIEQEETYGLVIIERDQATIGLLKGTRIQVLEELEGYVPGKHHKGGQSQRRFDRQIEQFVKGFYREVAEAMNKHFLPLIEKGVLRAIILGGPGYAKQDFLEEARDFLDYRVRQKIASKTVDVAYQGEAGLRELVIKAADIIEQNKYAELAKAVEEFKLHLAKDDGLAVYGDKMVKTALEMGALKYIIVDEERPDADTLAEEAKKYGTKVYFLSGDLPEAEWIRKTFKGLVGVLHFRIM
ncbi:peptide chain release factor aRF-1 [Hyperthermus butylicus]|uniref:Peptide chain release factor subunit 1 n=1 Tax=Hyperthermus butylicus (strain DSM 5456 / JCM 9403 / PLM1-5) TaxID=415426 RepID=A2BM42_HYPBU|nr:peptide chain release factor aRF-1 [Hyperthermus butylicus]ABM81053.1 Peptide chain release factor subunit 1 [Hyperthermus butylicus DSM 5456]